ncbi:MAG: serine/threonine protein kinase [Myxococcales bacterium]|nr:serine/threonine protein kinase [Myxococcales bacterium]MCB9669310.1 serine/threonine protein kinase [Alphaproteobacteria bacterium]MCB9690424.1 serine/threonine protein kinase [Alphaproteobacteria bacterium]
MPDEGPQQFGDYHLLEKIATGGMAEVWRARAYGLAGFEKILVIKKVLQNLAGDDEFIKLFIDEARISVQLLHVNIVQVFDLGEVNGQYYMAMEYVHGQDLARLVSRALDMGTFPIPLTLFVMSEVLKALQFAHERTDEDGKPLRIVHCDISPQNILVSYAGEVKITDFGISRAAFQAQALHEVIRGKYAYMSPEQVDGKELDGRSDLFSLGVVFFEMLTGRRLFKAKSRDETIARVRRADVPAPHTYRPEISADLEAIVLKSLRARPEDRYQSCAEMLEAIGVLMVQEGHRATNNDLAAFVRAVVEQGGKTAQRRNEEATPQAIVVVAVEAIAPPRSMGRPGATMDRLSLEWAGLADAAGGQVWEQAPGSALVCWMADDMRGTLRSAIKCALDMKKVSEKAGYRMSAGVAPGVARIEPGTQRPEEGWELAGPFYLARWMMNLSAHRGRALITEVGAKSVGKAASLLGRISILGNRYITLYEVG